MATSSPAQEGELGVKQAEKAITNATVSPSADEGRAPTVSCSVNADAVRERAERAVREDDIRSLLSRLSKDALINICTELALESADVYRKLESVAQLDPSSRKLFVRGLAWNSTPQSLQNLFEKYGTVSECAIITDRLTGKSKGYGFVTFAEVISAEMALKHPEKALDGRTTFCNLASVRDGDAGRMNRKRPRDNTNDPHGLIPQEQVQWSLQQQQQQQASARYRY